MARAHMACWNDQEQVYQHVCQEPSGRTCIEQECDSPAGTWWTPLWCPHHDMERLNRISDQFAKLAEGFKRVGHETEEPLAMQAVVTRSRLPALALALGVILVGVSFLYVTRDDPDEVTVDLHAAWTPQRQMTVHWQIGALISGENFTVDDPGQFNLTLPVPRGTELVILAEQGIQGGFLECQISVEGQEPVRDSVDNGENCRVETVAA